MVLNNSLSGIKSLPAKRVKCVHKHQALKLEQTVSQQK